ncbi:MAG TPA: 6-carboxytetrahydropterin synthase [Caulobacteraceae bacterium]|nr:6-carboxytetrahydropterin synthase [Caulobacteraceae bacterium]
MSDPTFEISKSARFDAAHYLEEGPPGSRYRRLHGHSFEVVASLRGKAQREAGWVEDLAAIDAALKAAALELDHGLLNDKPGLETPTLERLCLYFAERLRARFPALARVTVARPSSGERCMLEI